MEGRHPIAGSQNVCPSCRTRLRISLQGKAKTEFACPECGAALTARSTANGDVEVSAAEIASAPVPSAQPVSRLQTTWTQHSRTIAAVVTASIGILLAIFMTPSAGEPDHQTNRDTTAALPKVQLATAPDNAFAIAADPQKSAPPETIPELNQAFTDFPSESLSDAISGRETGSVPLNAATNENNRPEPPSVPENSNPQDIVTSKAPVVAPVDKTAAKPMSVRKRLEISIRSFRQTKPVPLRQLIRTVEQMSRVRVDVSAVPDEQLGTLVTLSLTETTPAEILNDAGRKSGLRAIVD